VAGGWWLVAGGWWLVAGGWRLGGKVALSRSALLCSSFKQLRFKGTAWSNCCFRANSVLAGLVMRQCPLARIDLSEPVATPGDFDRAASFPARSLDK